MVLIIFLWQTWEESSQCAPFLRLLGFSHLSPFHWVPLCLWTRALYHTTQLLLPLKSKASKDCTTAHFVPQLPTRVKVLSYERKYFW